MVVVGNSGVGVRVKVLKRVEKKDMHVGAVSSSQDFYNSACRIYLY